VGTVMIHKRDRCGSPEKEYASKAEQRGKVGTYHQKGQEQGAGIFLWEPGGPGKRNIFSVTEGELRQKKNKPGSVDGEPHIF